MHAIMRKFIFIAFLSVVSAANLILDYKCMPNVVCSSLMGGIRTGNSRGIQYINEFLITGIKPLHRAEGIAITCKPSFCGKPIKWGNVTISPSSSTPSCFEFPPVSTQESTPDGYKTCITQDEHSMFYNTIEKYYTNNNIRAGDAFYVTLTNIPEEGCF